MIVSSEVSIGLQCTAFVDKLIRQSADGKLKWVRMSQRICRLPRVSVLFVCEISGKTSKAYVAIYRSGRNLFNDAGRRSTAEETTIELVSDASAETLKFRLPAVLNRYELWATVTGIYSEADAILADYLAAD